MAAPEQTTTATTTTETPAPHELSAEKMMMDNLLILGMLFFIFYFILIRPQQTKLKAHRKMLAELKKSDRVVTSGGLIGTIIKLEGDDVVQVEIAPNVKVRVARTAIADVLAEPPSAGANDN